MSDNEKYKYSSKKEYSEINKNIVSKKQEEHEKKKDIIYYTINVNYYEEYEMYYLDIPKSYLSQITQLRQRKEDIFAKGKILTFTSTDNKDFYFDAVIDSTEDIYAYLVPIKEKYRYSDDLEGKYIVNERIGDLTYIRMKDAIEEFIEGNCCSKNIENFILGKNVNYNSSHNTLKSIINYNKHYSTDIRNFSRLTYNQSVQLNKIFYNEMNTIKLNANSDNRIICLIIYAIYQTRKKNKNKILICSSSNSVADSISLELLNMRKQVNNLKLLRIYAKNQEIIKRNRKLDRISFHKLVKKKFRKNFYDKYEKREWIIKNHDIIISTCVNSYNDDIINTKFPFVIIIDANNANENECLIPLTLNSRHVVLISYEDDENNNGNESEEISLYKRMRHLYPEIHINI